LLFLVSICVLASMGRPIFFFQLRPGLHCRPFRLIKFRSMVNAYDVCGRPLPDILRMTSFGRWLRSSSIDELPSLINVLRGEMSFVGPRPLLMQYLALYSPEQVRRHDVKPGITGWAQINGRNSISWEEKFRLDLWYVDNQSFLVDVRILLSTLWKVICHEGISSAGEATMAPFTAPSTRQ